MFGSKKYGDRRAGRNPDRTEHYSQGEACRPTAHCASTANLMGTSLPQRISLSANPPSSPRRYAKNAVVAGSITGNMDIGDKLELLPTAKVVGDLRAVSDHRRGRHFQRKLRDAPGRRITDCFTGNRHGLSGRRERACFFSGRNRGI